MRALLFAALGSGLIVAQTSIQSALNGKVLDPAQPCGTSPALLSGSLADVYGGSAADKTQWLLPQTSARTVLGISQNVIDSFAVIRRGAFRAPSFVSFDLSLLKRFTLTERVTLNFDANAFNILNRANFRPPQANLSSAFFGQISATALAATPRQIQFGLKLQS